MNLPRVETTNLEGVLQIEPIRFTDARGFFSETFNKSAFRSVGICCEFIQDNHSRSRESGTVRGLHFQAPPFAQAKLVRVVRGAVYDVAVDIRRTSATHGKYFGATLSAENGRQLFIPHGFAHGFCTLEPDTEVLYKIDAPYSREHERGVRWNDARLGIRWPVSDSEAVLNSRDRLLPTLEELRAEF